MESVAIVRTAHVWTVRTEANSGMGTIYELRFPDSGYPPGSNGELEPWLRESLLQFSAAAAPQFGLRGTEQPDAFARRVATFTFRSVEIPFRPDRLNIPGRPDQREYVDLEILGPQHLCVRWLQHIEHRHPYITAPCSIGDPHDRETMLLDDDERILALHTHLVDGVTPDPFVIAKLFLGLTDAEYAACRRLPANAVFTFDLAFRPVEQPAQSLADTLLIPRPTAPEQGDGVAASA